MYGLPLPSVLLLGRGFVKVVEGVLLVAICYAFSSKDPQLVYALGENSSPLIR